MRKPQINFIFIFCFIVIFYHFNTRAQINVFDSFSLVSNNFIKASPFSLDALSYKNVASFPWLSSYKFPSGQHTSIPSHTAQMPWTVSSSSLLSTLSTESYSWAPSIWPQQFLAIPSYPIVPVEPEEPAELIKPENIDFIIDDSFNNKTINLDKGDLLKITLASNPSTGYQWQSQWDKTLLSLAGHYFESSFIKFIGAAGTDIWILEAISPGSTTITFKYKRPWDTDAQILQKITFYVVINAGNEPPKISLVPEGPYIIDEGEQLNFTINGFDQIPDAWRLTFINSTLPTGAQLLDTGIETGIQYIFEWLPDFDQAGEYAITFAVSDGELSDSATINIIVHNAPQQEEIDRSDTKGLMLLIEYEDIEGLSNFVYELQERGISSVLMASAAFITEHCETIRKLQEYGMDVCGSCGLELWDIPYEEQYAIIKNTKEEIETCLGRPLKIINSRYMASDENTLKVAEELGIPYVTARGTTGTKATIYQPEEYTVRILSVSNMTSERWAYGSLCDYSVWSRGGTPEEFKYELYDALQHEKISPVSHTRISGLKANWYEVYMDFFDNAGVVWLDLDTFMETVDVTAPFSEIPQNWNVPYASSPYPLIPLDEEPNVDNPCLIENFPSISGLGGTVGKKIIFFHNGKGPMCLDFLDFINTIDYPIEEHIVNEENFKNHLKALITEFGSSNGVSESFDFYPIIFIKNKAFSGFNEVIKNEILTIM
ncbi:MAG: protease inhibitor I42 family protein [bacterium]